MGSNNIREDAVFYRDAPPRLPQLPSTTNITGWAEEDLRRWGFRLGRVRGG